MVVTRQPSDKPSITQPLVNDKERCQETLPVVTETQRALVAGCERPGRRKRAQIRVEAYSGVGAAYNLRKGAVCQKKCFHDLNDSNLLVASQSKGTAKDALDLHEINDSVGLANQRRSGR